jgi:hypothetical protein
MAITPQKSSRRRGRPTREEEVRRALAEVGCNPDLVDPLRVLASIAGDADAPASARVSAAKALLAVRDQGPAEDSAVAGDAVTVRAQQLLAARRKGIEMDEDDQIPVVEMYRGVGIEDQQPLERIERAVKPAIDCVHAMGDPDLLAAYAANADNPPEGRQFAAAKVEVELEIAMAERRLRPVASLEQIRASVAGLGCRRWRDRDRHASLLDADGGVERERPLDDLE